MGKIYTALGLMSGTSGDGVDASIIKSDGSTKYEVILDKYYKYTAEIQKEYTLLSNGIKDEVDYERYFSQWENSLLTLEIKITLFHIDLVNEIIKN